ncbi:MAG: DNA methyltransferase [Thermacetogeniaceae bacterium]
MEKRQELREVQVALLSHSRFNTRKTRSQEDISTLAERIKRIGFERTRAPWVVPTDSGFEVFAGGTRLEAAKLAGLETIPVLVHYGYTPEEISRLSDYDNECDEYHRPVPITDVWTEYARLYEEEGWTQEKIAEVKGVSQQMVSYRLKLHKLPEKIKGFTNQGLLSETHLLKIAALRIDSYFAPWLTQEQAMLELAEKAVRDKKKNGEKSVRALEADVLSWKEWIAYAEKVYNSLEETVTLYDFTKEPPVPFEYRPREEFVRELARRKARSLSAVKEAELAVRRRLSDSLERYKRYIEEKSAKAALERAKAEKVQLIVFGFRHGDARALIDEVPDGSVRLLLTDPPYGMEYRSNRRWASEAPNQIPGDKEREALSLLREVVQKSIAKLKEDAHVLVFCSWKGEPEVRKILEEAGLTIKGSLIWVKEEHSAGDVKGSFAPRHERIIHAVKGSPEVSPRKPDVFHVPRAKREMHPTEKPVELLKQLIECTTAEGDVVLDPFAGVASTCVAALELNRAFVAFEIDQDFYEAGRERLVRSAEEKVEEDASLQPGAA